jgi:hypothetical protein
MYILRVGLLTAIRQRGRPDLFYEVRIARRRGRAEVRRFDQLTAARRFADAVANGQGAVCTVKAVVKGRRQETIYTARRDDDDPRDGSSGVREPRRPVPGSSAGAVELDLPE